MLAHVMLMALGTLAAPPEKPRAAPELGQLKFFEGQWTCEGKVAATPGGAAQPVTVKSTIKLQPDRFWFVVRTAEQKAKDRPLPHEAQGYWGYDPINKQ